MSENAISIRNLTKTYRLYDSNKKRILEGLFPFARQRHQDFHALSDVSFDVGKGEIVGIIGKNGSGKSTLLKIITGGLTPTSGEINIHGRISALLELGTGFNPEYSGMENIYALLLEHSDPDYSDQYYAECFASDDLEYENALLRYENAIKRRRNLSPLKGGIKFPGVFAIRNVTGPKFFGFVGKNTGLSLPRMEFDPREDPNRGGRHSHGSVSPPGQAAHTGYGGQQAGTSTPGRLRAHGAGNNGAARSVSTWRPSLFPCGFPCYQYSTGKSPKASTLFSMAILFLGAPVPGLEVPQQFPAVLMFGQHIQGGIVIIKNC